MANTHTHRKANNMGTPTFKVGEIVNVTEAYRMDGPPVADGWEGLKTVVQADGLDYLLSDERGREVWIHAGRIVAVGGVR